MKRILLLLVLVFGFGNVFGQYVHTFTNNPWNSATNGNVIALSGINWTANSNGGFWGTGTNTSAQFGSSGSPATEITLKTSGIVGTISSVKITTWGASGISASVKASVGGTSFSPASTPLTTTITEYNFTGSGSGEVVIRWDVSARAVYVKKIDITYSTSCTAPTISTQPSTSTPTACAGTAFPQLSVAASGTNPTYQWYYNTTASNSGGTLINGATSSNYTPLNDWGTTPRYFYAVVSGCSTTVTSTVSGVQTPAAIPATPNGTLAYSPNPACGPVSVTYTYGTGEPSTNTYYWQTSSTGIDTSHPVSSPYALSASGTIYVRAFNGTCWSVASSIVVTVNTTPAISAHPSTAVAGICPGATSAVLSVTASGTSLSYQWYKSTDNSNATPADDVTVGTNAASFTPSNSEIGTFYYYVVVSGALPCPPVTSNVSGARTVNAIPTTPQGTITPTSSCGTATLTYNFAPGESTDGNTYYWQTSATGTSLANPVLTSTYTLAASGTRYVRSVNASGCWSNNILQAITINTLPNITGISNSNSVTIPNPKSFTVTATGTPTPTYQWQISTNEGVDWNNVTVGTGITTATYTTPATDETMNGSRYRCVVTNSCGSVNSSSGTLNLTNIAPNTATAFDGCIANSSISLTWSAPTSGNTPTGYIVFALEGTTAPRVGTTAEAGNANIYTADANFATSVAHGTLGKAIYKGNGTAATVSGLTPGIVYTFKVVAYRSESITAWATAITNATTASKTFTAGVPNATITNASIATNSSAITWTNPLPTSCYEILIVANQGPVVFTPTGDGTGYIANASYSTANQVVFKGNGTAMTVTGLTIDTEYCYKIFVRNRTTNEWSSGSNSFCRTTGLNYCQSYGNATDGYETGIRRVVFNTINNSTPAEDNGYSDFTATPTTVNLGETYNLSVYVNTDGNFTLTSKAWIDWNKDGDFLDSNEFYELGTANNVSDGISSLSPLSITVPTGASIGKVRMRISTKYGTDPSTSCEENFDGEVEDYAIIIEQPTGPEIYVKGNNQNIVSGSTTADPLNFTLFAGQTIGSSQEKTYEVGNVGLSNLLLTGTPIVKIEGANPGDFSVSQFPASSILYGNTSALKIRFTPTSSGIRTAIVSIANNDVTGNENPFTFLVQGNGLCNSITTTVTPASGPVGTEVTITATAGTITGGTVTFNGIAAISVTHISSTVIKAIVPAGATTGNIVVTNELGCPSTNAFMVITKDRSTCENASGFLPPSDLMIYEVYDEKSGSGGIVTIFNGTNFTKDLSNYRLYRAGNYGATYTNYAVISGTLAPGQLAIIRITGGCTTDLPDATNGTINGGFNEDDGFQLRAIDGNTVIDDFKAPSYAGYYLKRKLTAITPKTTFDDVDWVTEVLAVNECRTGIGVAPVLDINPPTITLQPIFTDKCGTTSLTIEATEGFNGGNALTYQWFFTAPGAATWSEIIDGGVYSGATTANLSVTSLAGLENYQFYAQVRENTNTCFTATNAVSVVASLGTVTWDGVAWVGGFPDKTKDVIINGIYSTVAGNFEARSLVNNGDITITDGGYIKIEYGLANNGPFKIKNNGSLVQVCDDALNTGIEIKVERIAKPMYRYDYTYWSSPVSPQTVGDLSPATLADKYFKWDTNFQDWTNILRSQEMAQGIGYIIRAPQTFSTNPLAPDEFTGNFEGAPNNGIVTASVEGSTTAQKWNLLGNPYPSAISADKFLDINQNPDLEGTIYVWTHNTPLDPVPNAEGFYSYAPNDYAVYNGIGGTATAPGAAIFEGYIASGQGFFVKGTVNGTATFNNEMRLTNHNTQFLRTPASNRNASEKSRIWLDISNAQNAFKQVLIGYVNRATNEIDREFDGEILGLNGLNLYSVISDKALAIQGRALPFDINDKVDLGYKTITAGNLTVSLSNSDGLFTDQNIYLEDKTLNIIHDLKQSDYTFASAIGTFNDRFVLRYTNETLSNPDFDLDNSIKIGVKDKSVTIKSSIENIQEIAVYDLLGRVIYDNKNVGSKEFTINELAASNQALIVKVYLENGTITNKKIVVN